MKGVAKRLTFSLVAVLILGGCAVYEPANLGPYAYGTDANGQPVYVAPPVYPYYYPYYYDPFYIGPPVFFDFGFRAGGHHGHDHDHDRGGHGDFRGGHGGGMRGGGMRGGHR